MKATLRPVSFRGPTIIVMSFLLMAIVNAPMTTYSIFLPFIELEFHASRAQGAFGMAVILAVQGLLSPSLGWLINRQSLTVIMLTGVLAMGVALCLVAQSTTLWQIGIVLATLFAAGFLAAGQLPINTMVANWYVNHRGLGLGIVNSGATITAIVLPPLSAWLIDQLGWRDALIAIAVSVVLLAFPLIHFFVIKRPEDIGQNPDGSETVSIELPDFAATAPDASGRLWSERPFWIIVVTTGAGLSILISTVVNMVPFAVAEGIDIQRASYLLSVLFGFMFCGQVVFSALADRTDKRAVLASAYLCQIMGLLLFIVTPSYSHLMFASALLGLGMGSVIPMQGILTGAAYGRIRFAQVFGWTCMGMLPLNLLLPPLAGHALDLSGSYDLIFSGFIGILTLLILLLPLLALPASEPVIVGEPAPLPPAQG